MAPQFSMEERNFIAFIIYYNYIIIINIIIFDMVLRKMGASDDKKLLKRPISKLKYIDLNTFSSLF